MTEATKRALEYLKGELIFIPKPDWSPNFECCIVCKKTKQRHKSNGKCANCYDRMMGYNKSWRLRNFITMKYTKNIEKDIEFLTKEIQRRQECV